VHRDCWAVVDADAVVADDGRLGTKEERLKAIAHLIPPPRMFGVASGQARRKGQRPWWRHHSHGRRTDSFGRHVTFRCGPRPSSSAAS
jgi:hypothetical protein